MGVQDSRIYLSRQVNNILQVFGSNVKISGLNIIINNDAKLINNKIASFTISPGKCIVDTTLHIFPTATTLELDVSSYDPSGYLVIVVSYKYTESLQQNRPIFKLLYVTHDGLDQSPDTWSPNRDSLILGVFKFNNQFPYNIYAYNNDTISIDSIIYPINPMTDTTVKSEHYLGGSDSEPIPDYNKLSLTNGDLYFNLSQKDLFVYNGWSPIETTFESDDNYNSGMTLYTLTLIKSGAGTGTIVSNPSGINCGSTCSYQFVDGTSVTLTATPDISSSFDGWSGDATGSSSTVTVTMISDKSITATFNPKDVIKYTLNVTKSGVGTGTVTSNPSGINCGSTCTYQFIAGTSITLTATPNSSSTFGGWSGDATGSSSTITITMNSNKSVIAIFNNLLYTLTVTNSGAGTGTIISSPAGINCGSTCSYQFASGTSVTLTATSDSSSEFGGWSGDATGIDTTVIITMNSNKSIIATFNPKDVIKYTLTVTKSGAGTGTVTSSPFGINCGTTCTYQFASGTNVTLTATPDSSSAFGGWSGDVTGSSSTVTVTMNSNRNVTAIFNILYILTVTTSGTGTGIVTSNPVGIDCGTTCSYQFASGTNVTLTAVRRADSIFGGWSGDVTGTSTTVTITMNSNKNVTATFNVLYTLTVTKSGAGTGTVTSNPSGINCGSTCSYQFASGTSVTLTATPDSSSVFSGWSGNVSGSSSTITIIMNSDKNMTATFNNALYTLTVTKAGSGTGTVTSSPTGINCGSTCSYQFVAGTNVTLTATPDSSSIFGGWSGDVVSTNATTTITMNSNKSVTATFNMPYTLTVTKSGTGTGTITSSPSGINCGSTCSYQFISGASVTLTATPNSSSTFGGWSGDATGTSTTITVTMNSNKNIIATFNTLSYALTVTKSGAGTGTIISSPSGISCGSTCTYQFASGTNVTLTATPDSSSTFGGWSGDATGTSTTTTVTMNSNKNVYAIFNTLPYTLTVTKSGTGTGTVSSSPSGIYCGSTCSYQFTSGISVTLTATPDSSSVFDGWSGDATDTSTTTTITMNSNKNVYAIFIDNNTGAGYFAGGYYYDSSETYYSFIDKLLFSDESRSTLAATLSHSILEGQTACNSSIAGYFSGGYNHIINDNYSYIDKLLFSNESRTTLTTVLSQAVSFSAACNSTLAGYFAGGGNSNNLNFIDKLLFSNESRTTLLSTLSQLVGSHSACNSILAGYFAGGSSGGYPQSTIDKLLFSSEYRTTLAATLSYSVYLQSACNSSLAGYFAGGANIWYLQTFIDKLLFSNESRIALSTTLSRTVEQQSACNSILAGYFAGGTGGGFQSFIEKLLFSNELRTTLTTTLSRSVDDQSACQSGGIL
jgi:uncharacterized protein (DUF2345 family)